MGAYWGGKMENKCLGIGPPWKNNIINNCTLKQPKTFM